MNHTRKTLQLVATIVVGATAFMGGCGPENLDDPTYLADISTNESVNDAADQNDAAMQPQEGMAEGGDQEPPQQGGGDGTNPAMMPQGGVAPVVGVAAPVVAVVPPVIPLPDAFVKLPPEFAAEPPIVTATGEQINYSRRVLFERDIHVAQPAIENHLVTQNVHTHNQYHTNVINHPSFRRDVALAYTASVSEEVLPTTLVTAPPVVAPGIVAPIGPPILPVAPFCAPWFSGGFLRACGPGI